MSSVTRVWFITGASSGFGQLMTETALERGDRVVATLRTPSELSYLVEQYPDRLFLYPLDVTDKKQVAAAFAAAKERFGRIDVTFNNAGAISFGEVESTPDDVARNLFEVNYWGAVNVTLKALEYFRLNTPQGGLLLQMSAAAGIEGAMGAGQYCATKAALEAISISVANELDPAWNVKVVILEPGFFRTKGGQNIHQTLVPQHPAYANADLSVTRFRKLIEAEGYVARGDPKKAVEIFYRVSTLENPPIRLPLLQGSIDTTRRKAKHLEKIADEYESWSEGIDIED